MSTLALRATVSGRNQQPAGDRAHPQVADDEQVRLDLLGQMQQRADWRADNRLLVMSCAPPTLARSRASCRIAYTEALPCIR